MEQLLALKERTERFAATLIVLGRINTIECQELLKELESINEKMMIE